MIVSDPADPNAEVRLEYNQIPSDIVKRWDALPADTAVPILATRENATLILNTMNHILVAMTSGQMASFMADQKKLTEANGYLDRYRKEIDEAFDGLNKLSLNIMQSVVGPSRD